MEDFLLNVLQKYYSADFFISASNVSASLIGLFEVREIGFIVLRATVFRLLVRIYIRI